MIAYAFFLDGRPRYIREVPSDGGADWGWVDSVDKAKPLSEFWCHRFAEDQIFCGRQPHFLSTKE